MPTSPHPLDPLRAEEVSRAVALIREEHASGDQWLFASVELVEPAKAALAEWKPGEPFARQARAVVWNRGDGRVYECSVDLSADELTEVHERPGVQPNFTNEEYHECDELVRRHPDVIAALARRGIEDLDLVLVDAWAYSEALVPTAYRDRRVAWCDVWVRGSEKSNPYAHFVGGLRPIVDVNRMELLELQDAYDPGLPDVMGEYRPELVPGLTLRDDLRPLEIRQPAGPSFTLDGNELRWQRWRMRIGFNHREGLVLHEVGYEDQGNLRPVAHRLSFAEMVVPYRDPSPDHAPRTAFDIGEWGLGYMTQSLSLGCDCLGEIRYLDAVLANAHGEPYEVRNAICVHEEDNGVLWKHVDDRAGAEVRRMRRLVVSFHATVANYEYLVYWRFYQDASIECEVRASGIMVTTTMPEGAPAPRHGTLVDRRTYAPYHQHFIVARLDLDIDGAPTPSTRSNPSLSRSMRTTPTGSRSHSARPRFVASLRRARDYDWATQRGMEGHKPRAMQRPWRAGFLQACADRLHPGADRPLVAGPATRPGDRPHDVDHASRRRRALAGRRVSDAGSRRRWRHALDRAEPLAREHRCRALVRVRDPPRDARRGLAGDAGRHYFLLAEAVRVLRPQPGPRRGA